MTSSTQRPCHDRRPSPTRIPTICVVDPQAQDYRAWNDSAAAHGIQLRIVAHADEALRLARTTAVDLWVVNTELPGLSGFELCTMLKARSTNAVVYLVADEYTPACERAAWTARATLFGSKPGHGAWLDEWIAHSSASEAPGASAGEVRTVLN